MTHSPIPISAAGQWIHCPGSCQLQSRYPEAEEGGKAALDGEAAHNCAARLLMGEDINVGDFAENTQIITEEMFNAAKLYYRDVQSVKGVKCLTVEKQVHAPHVSRYLYGTPDCWGVAEDTLIIWDFKFGYLPVEAFENWQGIGYACCILGNIPEEINKIQIRIVQPRANHPDGPIRAWSFPAANMPEYEQIITESINEALSPTAEVCSGPWCRNCNALIACPAAQEHGAAIMQFIDKAVPREPDPAMLAMELSLLNEAADMLEYRKKAIEGLVTSRIKAGERIPGYSIKPAYGRLSWSVDPDTAAAFGDTQDVDIRKPGVMTPTQAKAAGMDVDKITEKKQTGFKLIKSEPWKYLT